MGSNISQLNVEELYRELEELRADSASKRRAVNQLRKQIDDTVKKRNTLNAEVKRVAGEVKQLKSKRDSLNAKVKELKQKRDELRAVASKKRETLSKLLKQARDISDQLEGSMSQLSKQIQRLDWFIQTNPLAPQTERNIIAKIGELEGKLVKHKKLKAVGDKLLQLKIEVGALRIQAQSTHQQLTELAEESEKTHTTMVETGERLAQIRNGADSKHTEYLNQKMQLQDALSALKSNTERIIQIRAQIGRAKASTQVAKAEKVKMKYVEAANEKMRKGAKLSFEEFQALMETAGSGSDQD